jgi:hypothetical protein
MVITRYSYVVYYFVTRDKWALVTTAWRVLRVRMEEGLQYGG